MLFLVFAFLAGSLSDTGLPPRITAWKTELQTTGRRVAVARVYKEASQNALTLPNDTEQRHVFVRLLSDPAFVEQFIDMHAVTVHFDDAARRGSYVLVNMARHAEFARYEEALLAHEFAHIDLHIRGFRAPGVTAATGLCEAIQAGDVVQHILIRDELKRRGIDYVPFWIWTLEPALLKLQAGAGDPRNTTPCRRIARLTLWLDVWLGLPPSLWPRQGEFLAGMAAAAPDLIRPAWALYSYLYRRDLSHIEQYNVALQYALDTMHAQRSAPTDTSSR